MPNTDAGELTEQRCVSWQPCCLYPNCLQSEDRTGILYCKSFRLLLQHLHWHLPAADLEALVPEVHPVALVPEVHPVAGLIVGLGGVQAEAAVDGCN